MKSHKEKNAAFRFWTDEVILVIVALYFAFGLIGYITIALIILSVAVLLALYRLISKYSIKNEHRAKKLKIVLTSLVCFGLTCFILIEIPIIMSAHTDENPEAPYLIVLGAGVNGTEPSLSLADRLTAAKEYLEKFPETIVIVSGGQGQGEDITEAECMHRWLVKNGINADRIIMETKSTSTYENIRNSLKAIKDSGGDTTGKVAIVSSEYHLYRAKYYARELGAEALGIAGHSSYPILMINYFIREAFGVVAMWIM